jgi:uncharacterized membrane protein HdeD (DUF308 family)
MSDTGVDSVQKYLGRSWGLVLAFALVTLGLGVVLMVWPQETVVVVAVLLGIYLVVSGIFQLVASFTTDGATTGLRVFGAIAGVLSILLGLFAFRSLAHAVTVLALLIGFGWLLRGVAEVVGALADKDMPGRGWAVTIGVVSALAGLVVLAWPAPSLNVLVWVTGIWLVVLGLFEVLAAFALRKVVQEA